MGTALRVSVVVEVCSNLAAGFSIVAGLGLDGLASTAGQFLRVIGLLFRRMVWGSYLHSILIINPFQNAFRESTRFRRGV